MSYGEMLGDSTLAWELASIAEDIYARMENGVPWSELRGDCKNLVEGSMELWERMMEE